jgi:hypothetical protein
MSAVLELTAQSKFSHRGFDCPSDEETAMSTWPN